MGQTFHKFQNSFRDVFENKIVNFPQLQCPVGTFRSNLVNFVKIKIVTGSGKAATYAQG